MTRSRSAPSRDSSVVSLLSETDKLFEGLEQLRARLRLVRSDFPDWEAFHAARVQLGQEIREDMRAVPRLLGRARDILLRFDFEHASHGESFTTKLEAEVVPLLPDEPEDIVEVHFFMRALRGLLLQAQLLEQADDEVPTQAHLPVVGDGEDKKQPRQVSRLPGAIPASGSVPPSIELLNEYELAKVLKVSVQLVRRWRSQGKGPPFVRLDGKSIRYRTTDVEVYLLQQAGKKKSAPATTQVH